MCLCVGPARRGLALWFPFVSGFCLCWLPSAAGGAPRAVPLPGGFFSRPLCSSVVSVCPLVCCVFPVAVCRLSAGSFLGLPAPSLVFPAALRSVSCLRCRAFAPPAVSSVFGFPRPVRFASAPAFSCGCCPPGLSGLWFWGCPSPCCCLRGGCLLPSPGSVGVGCRRCGFGVWVVWWLLFFGVAACFRASARPL